MFKILMVSSKEFSSIITKFINKEEGFFSYITSRNEIYLELLGRMQYDMTIDKDAMQWVLNGYAFQNHFLNSFRNTFPTII